MFGQVLTDSSTPPALAAVVLAAGASTRMGRPKALLTWRGRTFVRSVVALAEAAGAAPIVVVEGAVALPPAVLGPAVKVTNPTWSNGQTDSLRRGLQALLALTREPPRNSERPSTLAPLPAPASARSSPASSSARAPLPPESSSACAPLPPEHPSAREHLSAEHSSARAPLPPEHPSARAPLPPESSSARAPLPAREPLSAPSVPPFGLLVLTVDRPHLRPDTVCALAAAFRAAPGQIWQPAHQGRRGHPILYPPGVIPDLLGLGADETARDLLARPAIAALRRTLAVDDPAVLDNLDRPADLARLP